MKISILVPDGGKASGGGRVIADYAEYLASNGHEVVAYVVNYGSKVQRFTDKFINNRKYHSVQISSILPNAPYARRYDGLSRIRVDDVEDSDLVISTWWETAEWMRQLPAKKGKQIHFVQGHEIFSYLPKYRTREVYSRPDTKIAVSRWLQNILMREYGRKSKLVMNGVDTDIFRPISQDADKSVKVGFVWSPNVVKNMQRSISAIGRAKEFYPSLRAHVFGAQDRPEELPGWVKYEPYPIQSRIVEIYSECDAWLFTSDSEGFGLPILEAMACGTPVIATEAGAAPELVMDGVNGRLLPFDADAFRLAILEVAEMSDLKRKEWSAAARRTAENNDISFSRKRFEQILKEIYADR